MVSNSVIHHFKRWFREPHLKGCDLLASYVVTVLGCILGPLAHVIYSWIHQLHKFYEKIRIKSTSSTRDKKKSPTCKRVSY